MFRDKSDVNTSFMPRLFLAVNCGGGGDSSGCNTDRVAGGTWQHPAAQNWLFCFRVSTRTLLLFVAARSPALPTCWEPRTLLLGSITAPLEFRQSLGISLTCKSGQDQERAHLSRHRLGGGGGSCVAPSKALPPQSRQVILTARTLPVSHWPSDWMHIHLQIMLCDSRAAEHHFNMQIDSSEALHYAFSGLFSD